MSYFAEKCPKCGNNDNGEGKIISRNTPTIAQDPKRKDYYHCWACENKWLVED